MEGDLTNYQAHAAAIDAVDIARKFMPKMTGAGARSLQPLWGPGFFGIRWDDNYVWFQEIGINPFTMSKLAGKIIPMWIKDPTGIERRKNPKAKTKTGEDGVIRVLVFRRAAKPGQRKVVRRADGTLREVPASYPGAPGRIGRREVKRPLTGLGRLGGQIARGNIGVRWRHPGLIGRSFLYRGLIEAAIQHGLDHEAPVHASTSKWR